MARVSCAKPGTALRRKTNVPVRVPAGVPLYAMGALLSDQTCFRCIWGSLLGIVPSPSHDPLIHFYRVDSRLPGIVGIIRGMLSEMLESDVPELTAASTPSKSLKARFRNFKGRILASVGPDSYQFSASGAFILSQIDGGTSIGQIAALLSREYSVDLDAALLDAIEFAEELLRLNIAELRIKGCGAA